MSTVGAMSGTLATIFSLEKSRKWIIRDGGKGISAERIGSADRQRLEEVPGVAHAAADLVTAPVNGAARWQDPQP